MSSALQELLRLPVDERIEAINLLWDSVDAERTQSFDLSDEEREELDRRLDDAGQNPGVGCSWEELRRELLTKK